MYVRGSALCVRVGEGEVVVEVPGVDAGAWADAVGVERRDALGQSGGAACGGGRGDQVVADGVDEVGHEASGGGVGVGRRDEVAQQESAGAGGEHVFVGDHVRAGSGGGTVQQGWDLEPAGDLEPAELLRHGLRGGQRFAEDRGSHAATGMVGRVSSQ
ncbi:hypothetical protein GCM10009647_079550 [Streptomyces sanglieri]